MVLVSGTDRLDYLGAYLVVLAFTDVHRHYGLPYVYLDSQVFRRHPLRFTLFPLVMLLLFAGSPFFSRSRMRLDAAALAAIGAALVFFVQILRRDAGPDRLRWRPLGVAAGLGLAGGGAAAGLAFALGAPGVASWGTLTGCLSGSLALDVLRRRAGRKALFVHPVLVALAFGGALFFADQPHRFRPRGVLAFVAVVAGVWNIWHVYMQKYGILRLYHGKARVMRQAREGAREVPGWVDRALLFGWMPLYLFYLTATYREEVFRLFPQGRRSLGPLFDVFEAVAPVLLPVAIAFVVGIGAAFLWFEHRAHGLRNRARLTMAAGTTLLAATFLVVHPLKAYLAFAFGHAVEYMVFVWAYQRRRYRSELAHRPPIARALRYPITVYVVSAVALGVLFIYFKYYGRWLWPEADQPRFLRFRAMEWIGYWTIFQSMVHFYFDGFLWKMRLPEVRATIGAGS
jgi:hypothetical protein